jgi:hypothetical protein
MTERVLYGSARHQPSGYRPTGDLTAATAPANAQIVGQLAKLLHRKLRNFKEKEGCHDLTRSNLKLLAARSKVILNDGGHQIIMEKAPFPVTNGSSAVFN